VFGNVLVVVVVTLWRVGTVLKEDVLEFEVLKLGVVVVSWNVSLSVVISIILFLVSNLTGLYISFLMLGIGNLTGLYISILMLEIDFLPGLYFSFLMLEIGNLFGLYFSFLMLEIGNLIGLYFSFSMLEIGNLTGLYISFLMLEIGNVWTKNCLTILLARTLSAENPTTFSPFKHLALDNAT